MKYIKLYILAVLCIGVLSAIYLPIYNTSATPTSEVIILTTEPDNNFVSFNNMAPGDKISKNLRVINEGNVDFNYTLSAIKEAGDQTLFDNLVIKITEKSVDIFEGSLKDLNKLNLGELLSFKKDELVFTVELPKDVGNEVKRKSTSVAFNFVASGLNDSVGDSNNQLPKTATNNLNFFLLGLLVLSIGILVFFVQRKLMHKNVRM